MPNHAPWNPTRLFRRFVICTLTLVIIVMGATVRVSPIYRTIRSPIAWGQLPSLTAPTGIPTLPMGVERRGTLEATGIRLDGQELFRIASPAVLNRNEPGGQIPVEVRARQVETNLVGLIEDRQILDQGKLDPDTLQVVVEARNGQPVLLASDAALPEPRVLLTVTDADAQYHLGSKDRLAVQWQGILETALRQALRLRQPEAFKQQVSTVVRVLGAMVLLTLLLGGIWTFLGRRKQQLERRQATDLLAAPTEGPPGVEITDAASMDSEYRLGLFQDLRHHFGLQRRLQLVRFLRWLLFWAIAFLWVVGIAYSLNTFPQTRQFARKVITIPVVILVAWFLTGLVNRLTDLVIERYLQVREQEQTLTEANIQRITTIARVIKGLKMVLVYAISILWVLQWLNLAPASILTLGALVALAVSFAAQSLVKDLVNGFLILLEDQFRIGDLIKLGTNPGYAASGLVVNLNLRITQIRSDDGNLITLPNSCIVQVENMSRTWARADFRIEVAYNTDVDHALALVRETVDQMAQEPEWQSMILDTQELFGVDQISHTGIVIRVWIKTAPLKQGMIARELRRRLKIAFDRQNIQIGTPQQVLMGNLSSTPDSTEIAEPE